MNSQQCIEVVKEFDKLYKQLKQILVQKKFQVALSHRALRDIVFLFVNTKPTIKEKVAINNKIRNNIQRFISEYIQPKIKVIVDRNEPYYFVQVMSELWGNFQRFVFAHNFVIDKMKQFFETFYKMSNAKQYSGEGEVLSIPIIAINELHKFFEKKNIFKIFPRFFSDFISQEREGKSVPREMLKQSVNAVESAFFDFDAIIKLDINAKPCIVKGPRPTDHIVRRAKDAEYFQNSIMSSVLENCKTFYKNLVKEKMIKMAPTDEIEYMLKILAQEESRSVFYIHTPQNQIKYMNSIDQAMIATDLKDRINKDQGLSKYLREYQVGKPEYVSELSKFWKIYTRILNKSLPIILKSYDQYLDDEAKIVQPKLQKQIPFIEEMIRVNMKNVKIIEIFGKNFELQNKRNEKIRCMLSNQIIKTSQYKGKHTMGATNLAFYINNKFQTLYGKSAQDQIQTIRNVQLLFKILQEKVHFTKQHEKHLALRLLQQIDFNKDIEYTNIIKLQKQFIDEMQKQMGVSEVKELLQNIKDVEKSYDHTKKLKDRLGGDLSLMNQIIVKNNTFWPEKINYQIIPPNNLFKISNAVENYFKNTASNVQFEYGNGVSLFQGTFASAKTPKQNFSLRNIYMIILLLLDETEDKKLFYADIKTKIKSYGANKQKGNLELAKCIIDLYIAGMIKSSTKKIVRDSKQTLKIAQSDQFEINVGYDYEQQLKKIKFPNPKKLQTIKTAQILQLTPNWLKDIYAKLTDQLAEDEVSIQKQRRTRVKQIAVKVLKHAHHSSKDCNFEQLFNEYAIAKHKQFRVTQKYLKQVVQELINDEYCQRVQGQRNVFKYKA